MPGKIISNQITVRDYFAGQALAGIISYQSSEGSVYWMMEEAYKLADLMMKERDKTNK